jgi:multiple sugar transport system ATP-binding protein
VLPWMRLLCPSFVREYADRKIEVGIRPENLLAGEACLGMPEACRFEAEVSVVEPMGPESLVIVTVAGQDLQMRLMGRSYPQAGERIGCAIDPAELHVFDAASGVSLRR